MYVQACVRENNESGVVLCGYVGVKGSWDFAVFKDEEDSKGQVSRGEDNILRKEVRGGVYNSAFNLVIWMNRNPQKL